MEKTKTKEILVAPSVLSCDFARLGEEIKAVSEAGADYIHMDVMDGHFVPNITFGPGIISSVRKYTDKVFDVHLMIENPEKYIEKFAAAGSDIITVHAEATHHLDRLIHQIKDTGKLAGVSLNPHTSEDILKYVIDDIDMVLVMSVNPGFGGQKFIPSILPKIEAIHKMRPDLPIEVDGGITDATIGKCIAAGASIFVAGSYVFGGNYRKRIESLKNAAINNK